jgi:cytochrome c-type biogenesis protein CcmH
MARIPTRVPAWVWLTALLLAQAGVAAETPPLESRARLLERKLMAPCCFTQTIDQHESEAARAMRAELRQLLAQGLTDEQVLDHYVERHGPRILAVPPAQGFGRLLYWVPSMLTGVLLVAVCLLLRSWYRRGRATPAARLP